MFGAPFAKVVRLRAGDPVTVVTGEGTFTYNVDGIRREGDPLRPLAAGAGRLTLVTSNSAGGSRRRTVFVDATLNGTPQPDTSGRLTSLPSPENYMRGNQEGLVGLVIWLQALVAVLVAVAWASVRWGLKPTLLVGVPVVVAGIWGVTEAASQLLPNLF